LLLGVGLLGVGIWGTVYNFRGFEQASGLQGMQIGIIVLGAFVTFVSFFGCCGAVMKNSAMLRFYGFLMFLIIAAQIALGAAIYTHTGESQLKSGLATAWSSANNASKSYVENELHCCGLYSNATALPGCKDMNTPCLDKLVNWLQSVMNVVAIVAIVFGSIQLFPFLFSCCLARSIAKSKEDPLLDDRLREAREYNHAPSSYA